MGLGFWAGFRVQHLKSEHALVKQRSFNTFPEGLKLKVQWAQNPKSKATPKL